MKRFILPILWAIPAALFSFGSGCVTGLPSEWYMQAYVQIVTATSETGFTFHEPCFSFSYEIDQDTRWHLYANDMDMPFGISISWKESSLSGPGSFQAHEEISIWIMRENPDPEWWSRSSPVDEGLITFTQVGYRSGDVIEGTFDGLRLSEWDMEKDIEVRGGVFRCRIM